MDNTIRNQVLANLQARGLITNKSTTKEYPKKLKEIKKSSSPTIEAELVENTSIQNFKKQPNNEGISIEEQENFLLFEKE